MAARKKVAKTVIDERHVELGGERGDDDDESLGLEKARIAFGKFEQVIQMKVYRVSPEGDEALQSFEYDPDVHTEDFLRGRYGPGKYRIRFRDLQTWKYLGQFTVRLGAVPGEVVPGAATASAAPGFEPLPYFMREAEKSREQFNTIVLAMLSSKGGGDGEGSMAALIKAQSEQAGRAEERNMVLLQKLMDRSSGTGGVETVMKALELGMNAVADIKVDSEGGSWVSALRSVAKELGPVLSQLMVQKQAGAASAQPVGVPAQPLAGAPGPALTPNLPAQSESVQNADVFRGLLTRYAPIALQAATEGKAPMEFAGHMLDSVGVSYHSLFDSLQSNDLVSLQPQLGGVKWNNPEDGTESLWVDEVVRLLHKRDWGLEEDQRETGGVDA